MNKILMDGELLVLNDESQIEVKGNSTIHIYNLDKDINLNITMDDNSELLILDFNLIGKSANIKIVQNNNSKVNYIHTFKITSEYHLNYVPDIK